MSRTSLGSRFGLVAGIALALSGCNDDVARTAKPIATADTPAGCAAPVAAISAESRAALRAGSALVTGALGCLPAADRPNAEAYAATLAGDSATGQFRVRALTHDQIGAVHVRLDQRIDDLPVVGGELVVHARAASGEVYAVSGRIARAPIASAAAPIDVHAALARAAAGLAERAVGEVEVSPGGIVRQPNLHPLADAKPELRYLVTPSGDTRLVWVGRASYESSDGPELDLLFADAHTGALLARHPQYHRAKHREVFSANNGSSLPGALVISEGGASADVSAQAAYDYAGATYDFFQTRFGRDSVDDGGAVMRATVHFGQDYNNAFWNGFQMVYGDGDGNVFGPLSESLDVVAHELTHGITQHTANLIYLDESGALNEAMSDIFAAAVTASVEGEVNDGTWLVGDDVFTPGIDGDALRFMHDPVLDGSSRDFYPDRYVGPADNGGVHWNSGIANLAFYLLSEGGTHPRGKSNVVVPAIGIDDASAVFYRALAVYLTSQSQFEDARAATGQAAVDLFGADSAQAAAVALAWDAVGVGSDPVPPPDPVDIDPGQTVDGIDGTTGSWHYFRLDVPPDQSGLTVSISGASGDADLYLRHGALPTEQAFDCRPFLVGSVEQCEVANPAAGEWMIGIRAFSSYSGVSLTATVTSDIPEIVPFVVYTGVSGEADSLSFFRVHVPEHSRWLVVSTWGGSGNADLYLRHLDRPDDTQFDCRSTRPRNRERCRIAFPEAGDWIIGLHGAAAFSHLKMYVRQVSLPRRVTSGETTTDLSGVRNSWGYFYINVPTGASKLTVRVGGGTGDVDLYVRRARKPSRARWVCRPFQWGNEEECTIDNPRSGRWFIGLHGYDAFEGVSLDTLVE